MRYRLVYDNNKEQSEFFKLSHILTYINQHIVSAVGDTIKIFEDDAIYMTAQGIVEYEITETPILVMYLTNTGSWTAIF